MLLKPNMILPASLAASRRASRPVANANVGCFLRLVPAAVLGIAFLSGGQPSKLASDHLNVMTCASAAACRGRWRSRLRARSSSRGSDGAGWSHAGRSIHFGMRGQAMGAIDNGLATHGGFIAYGSTFLISSDYVQSPIRLAALMGLHVIHIFTHDSLALGEDGPTHQPIEQLATLRAIPRLTLTRPADANETAVA